MNTQFDFVSSANGVMFLMSLVFIVGYVLLNEVMKPEPFGAFIRALREDMEALRAEGAGKLMELGKKVAMAPVYGVMYIVSVPLLFTVGLLMPVGRVVAAATSFGWSPVRAYFRGRRSSKKSGDKKK